MHFSNIFELCSNFSLIYTNKSVLIFLNVNWNFRDPILLIQIFSDTYDNYYIIIDTGNAERVGCQSEWDQHWKFPMESKRSTNLYNK